LPVPLPLARRTYLVLYPGAASPIDAVSAVVLGDGEYIVVDSGSGLPASIEWLAASIAMVAPRAAKPPKARLVVNTHGHVNNAGGDWWFHSTLKAIIAARDPDARWIETGDPVKTAAARYGVPFKGAPVGLRIRDDPFTVELPGAPKVEVIHTPGHTPGSQTIVVYDSKKVVFVGDALGSLSREWDSDERAWLESLERIRGLRADVLCTSVLCYEGEAAKAFVEAVAREGPRWVDEENPS